MGGTYIHFPKKYELDDYFYVLIIRFVRYEILTNIDKYSWKLGLKKFVSDMEKEHWHLAPERVTDFGHYCGGAKAYPEFVKCLERVREQLLSFGEKIPEEWKEKLKVTPDDEHVPIHYPVKKVVYWLDCLRQAVNEYKANIGVTTFPFAPD
jgi:hypothetical protein